MIAGGPPIPKELPISRDQCRATRRSFHLSCEEWKFKRSIPPSLLKKRLEQMKSWRTNEVQMTKMSSCLI